MGQDDSAIGLEGGVIRDSASGILAGWLLQQGLPMLRSAHSSDCEFEADKDGACLASAAGYDSNGAITFLKRIGQLGTNPDVLGEYFASHPSPEERISMLASLHPLNPGRTDASIKFREKANSSKCVK